MMVPGIAGFEARQILFTLGPWFTVEPFLSPSWMCRLTFAGFRPIVTLQTDLPVSISVCAGKLEQWRQWLTPQSCAVTQCLIDGWRMNMWGGDGKLEIPRLQKCCEKKKKNRLHWRHLRKHVHFDLRRNAILFGASAFFVLLMWWCFHNMELQCVVQFDT